MSGLLQVTQKGLGAGAGSGDSTRGAGKDGVLEMLVMENIFYGHATSRIYDLKGSERSRYSAEDPSDHGTVLMDDNLRESNLSAPILIDPVAYAKCVTFHCLFTLAANHPSTPSPRFCVRKWNWWQSMPTIINNSIINSIYF